MEIKISEKREIFFCEMSVEREFGMISESFYLYEKLNVSYEKLLIKPI